MKEGQGKDCTRKSKEISITPTAGVKGTGAVTPGNQPISEREQQSSKKKCKKQKMNYGLILWEGRKGAVAVQRGDPNPIDSS